MFTLKKKDRLHLRMIIYVCIQHEYCSFETPLVLLHWLICLNIGAVVRITYLSSSWWAWPLEKISPKKVVSFIDHTDSLKLKRVQGILWLLFFWNWSYHPEYLRKKKKIMLCTLLRNKQTKIVSCQSQLIINYKLLCIKKTEV